MNFPISTILFSALAISFFSLIGVIVYNSKKDKIFLAFSLLPQLVVIAIRLEILKEFANILLILSAVTVGILTIFLFIKDDKKRSYLSISLHVCSLFQLFNLLNLIY